MKKKVIFVCLGNICRSPSAEAVMRKFIEQEGLSDKIEVDSAGTIDYHQGEPADTRMKWHAAKRGYELNHRAKKIDPKIDFSVNDYIIAMDNDNYRDIIAMDKEKKYHYKIYQMAEFAKEIKFEEVPDPYYGGSEGFETVLDILEDGCRGLLEKIKNDFGTTNNPTP